MNAIQMIKTGLSLTQKISPHAAGFVAARLFLTPRKIDRPDWEQKVLSQAVRTGFLHGSQYWVYGEKEGEPNKPLVVCVHGWSGRGSQFGRFIPKLVEQGYRVLIFDGPAHGESPGRRTNVNVFSAWILDLEKKEGPFYALIGHSFGGSSVVVALSRGIKVQKVVLIAMPANLERMFQHFSGALGLSESARNAFLTAVEGEVKMSMRQASPVLLAPHMKVPALVLHDPHDREVGFKSAEELKESWPELKLVPAPHAGHYRILKNEFVIQTTLDYLELAHMPVGNVL